MSNAAGHAKTERTEARTHRTKMAALSSSPQAGSTKQNKQKILYS